MSCTGSAGPTGLKYVHILLDSNYICGSQGHWCSLTNLDNSPKEASLEWGMCDSARDVDSVR